MKDYQGAISRIVDEYIPIHYEGTPTNQQTEDALLLQELVNEKLEQESRKDKLVVGSKWECIVSCFANDSMFYKVGTKVKVLSLEEYERVFFVRVKSEWQEVIFVVDQFLLCFKPLKEEE